MYLVHVSYFFNEVWGTILMWQDHNKLTPVKEDRRGHRSHSV
jgi:hypothetical protein